MDDPILRKHTSFDEMKADEYRYWQSRPVHERIDAVEEMIETAYALKGWKIEPAVGIERFWRVTRAFLFLIRLRRSSLTVLTSCASFMGKTLGEKYLQQGLVRHIVLVGENFEILDPSVQST